MRRAEKAAAGGCQLDVMVLSEVVGTSEVQKKLLPINSLRNAAFLAAKTELVLSGDVALLVGSSLNDALASEKGCPPPPPAAPPAMVAAHTCRFRFCCRTRPRTNL